MGIVGALHQVLQTSEQDIARRIFQAPAELLSGVSWDVANEIAGLLAQAGLDAVPLPPEGVFVPGDAAHELALSIERFDRVTDIVRELQLLVGGTLERALAAVCAVPAVIVGQVSLDTAETIRSRFVALGATVDISIPLQATFTCISENDVLDHEIRRLGWNATSPNGTALNQPRLYCGLSYSAASELWSHTSRLGLPPQIVNDDFARYDVLLLAAPDTAAARALLSRRLRITETIASRVLANVPVVILHNARPCDADVLAEEVAACGGTTVRELLATQRFAVSFASVTDPDLVLGSLRSIGGLEADAAAKAVQGEPLGRLTSTEMRWIQHIVRQSRAAVMKVSRAA